VKVIVAAIAGPIIEILQPLKQRIADLEARPALKYAGVWDEARTYQPGEFTTHNGCLWHCNETNNSARPGSGSAVWTLAVKAGRDARR